MEEKETQDAKIVKTATRTRRNTRATKKVGATGQGNGADTRATTSNVSGPKAGTGEDKEQEKAKLKEMAVSLVGALTQKDGRSLSKKIRQLDRSLKEEKRLRAELADSMGKLEKFQEKVHKLEEKIEVFAGGSKELKERCAALKERIGRYKDGLASEISEL